MWHFCQQVVAQRGTCHFERVIARFRSSTTQLAPTACATLLALLVGLELGATRAPVSADEASCAEVVTLAPAHDLDSRVAAATTPSPQAISPDVVFVATPASAVADNPPVQAEFTPKSRAAHSPERSSWSDVAAQAQRGSVGIVAGGKYGSGFLIAKGLVVTNLHVIDRATQVSVLPWSGDAQEASVLARDAELDLALLAVPQIESTPVKFAKEPIRVGEEVLAVGSPKKMFFSVSRGMVSHVNRSLRGVRYLQTDLPINSGNSGGPLINREGQIVGVVTFVLRDSQGLSFALPVDQVESRFAEYLSGDIEAARETHRAGAAAPSFSLEG